MRTCTKCGESKPLTECGRKASNRDGLQARCKPCVKEDKAASYMRHRESELAKRHADYLANREERIAAAIEWKRANPTKVREYRRINYERNRERSAEQARAWREANPEKWRENLRTQARKRRARKLGAAVGDIDLTALWTGCCALCDAPLDAALAYPHPLSKSVDHIVPLSKGGSHEQSNLQWAHLVCNNRKGASSATTPAADSPPRVTRRI